MKKLAIAVGLATLLVSFPVQAKTLVGVLWPMFGPAAAPGLVELVAELKAMPDVEVRTYLHQSWPDLVADIGREPPGTRTLVVGYSLGANSTAFVANKAKYIDAIIALQPSMLSWNPPVTGKVGRMIEIYNPNPWLTWGGMGSKKLTGGHIEYITNTDSHPGAQFSAQFRDLVKSEIAQLGAEDRVETAQAAARHSLEVAQRARPAESHVALAQAPTPKSAERIAPEPVAAAPASGEAERAPESAASDRRTVSTAFLDAMTGAVNSGDLSGTPALTPAALRDYARRTYGTAALGNDVIAAAFSRSGAL